MSAALIPCLAVHAERGSAKARGGGKRGCEGEDKENQLEGEERRERTRLVYVRFMGLDLVSAWLECASGLDVFFPFLFPLLFLRLLFFFFPSPYSSTSFLPITFTLLVPSLRSLSLARPLNAILETSQRFSSETRRRDSPTVIFRCEILLVSTLKLAHRDFTEHAIETYKDSYDFACLLLS